MFKDNISPNVSEGQKTPRTSNKQEIEKEAAVYHTKRTEVNVTYLPSNSSDDQSISISVPSWDDSNKLASFFAPTIEQLLPIAAWRGSSTKQILLATRDIHLIMREQYTQMIHQIGRNIFPCIIASENDMHYRGVGSMFTLYLEDGSTRRTKAPPSEYEIYKNLSHMPLCIYTMGPGHFTDNRFTDNHFTDTTSPTDCFTDRYHSPTGTFYRQVFFITRISLYTAHEA